MITGNGLGISLNDSKFIGTVAARNQRLFVPGVSVYRFALAPLL